MAGVLHLWNEWEIQILVLLSFALQVFLLIFARLRRRSISGALRILLWLMYLMAEYTITYTVGHMSISCKLGEHQELMAFWAPFLLVHLGGQDTITAYAMEDSQLWLRHLLSFAVQALGAAYVLYKSISSHGPLVAPAVLMFLVGVLKNGERVWALNFSRLEILRRYLDGVSIKQNRKSYSAGPQLDDECVLQGAHDLFYISLGQFVDDKIKPSVCQHNALEFFHTNGKTFELIEMQLSLMHDIFYTKAAVIHTWYGRCARVISLLATVVTFFLFQFSTGKDVYNRVDAAVTYILVIGAFILETASVFRAMGSTWTCAMLKVRMCDWLHNLHLSLRRCVRIAEARRWSGSIGQLNLLDDTSDKSRRLLDKKRRLVDKKRRGKRTGFVPTRDETRGVYGVDAGRDRRSLGFVQIISFWINGSSMIISTGARELVLEEIRRLAKACKGMEDVMTSYRGQCALEQHDGFFKDLTTWSTGMEFDQSIVAWHLATDKFLRHTESSKSPNAKPLVEATRAVSNYMMFLLVERPYMLPSPVRTTLHLQARKVLPEWHYRIRFMERNCPETITEEGYPYNVIIMVPPPPEVLTPGAKLADELLRKEMEMTEPNVLPVVFGVWVEMLCYAAHHCSRDSHARQLNIGGEFITIVWLLTVAEFNRVYGGDERLFKERTPGSIWNFMNYVNFNDFMETILKPLFVLCESCGLCIYNPDSMALP